MALSDKRIIQEKKNGNIIITPFQKENLNTSSYDVCIGEYFFREQQSKNKEIYNIYNATDTKQVWGKPQRAKKASVAFKNNEIAWNKGIKTTDKIILLQPGETILAHTIEFIGGKNTITTMMQARSSIGRNFIEVCKCAGWGDVGYTNRWTMEITNNSRYYSIPLVVGRRIAQIVFMETGEIENKDYASDGKYSNSGDIKKLKKQWQPSDMLPKLSKERELKK